jgi:mono/diheme cytochrome c family protein
MKACAMPQETQMKWHGLMVGCVVITSVCSPGSVRAADSAPAGQRDLAAEIRGVFAAKCAGCHGPDVAKPKGRFGYVLDLARVASNREMIVPFRPAESELWELVERGEMPPADAPTGALTAQQKAVIKAWIAAGASPVASGTPNIQPAGEPTEAIAAEPIALPTDRHFLLWIGKFHLLLLHFPIALLIAAAVGESWSMLRRRRVPDPAVRFCVLLGAASALATVVLGWFHALSGFGSSMPQILTVHRWIGTGAGLWVIFTAVLSERDARRDLRSGSTRVLLFVGALLIGLAGHFGGVLAHGEDFFNW